MHCHNCGRQIAEGSGFCAYCGVPQNRTAAPQPMPRPVPPVPPVPPMPARPPMGYVPTPTQVPVGPAVTQTPPVPQETPAEEPVRIQEIPEVQEPSAPTREFQAEPEVTRIPEPVAQEPIPVVNEEPLPEEKTQKPKKRFPVLALILGLLLVASLALSAYLYMEYQDLVDEARFAREQFIIMQDEYDDLQQDYDRQADNIQDLQEKLDKQKKNNEDLQKQVKSKESTISKQKKELEEANAMNDLLVKSAKSGPFGYAADHFRTNSAVYVVKKSSTNTNITLWAYWNNGGTVFVDYAGDAAWLNFNQNSWKTSTTMTIKPQKVGFTIATFTNNVDSKTFNVLIIVTD